MFRKLGKSERIAAGVDLLWRGRVQIADRAAKSIRHVSQYRSRFPWRSRELRIVRSAVGTDEPLALRRRSSRRAIQAKGSLFSS